MGQGRGDFTTGGPWQKAVMGFHRAGPRGPFYVSFHKQLSFPGTVLSTHSSSADFVVQ